jgi:hypothetical protein
MADADHARQWIIIQDKLKIAQFTGSPAAIQLAIVKRCDTGGIIAAIFETFESIH